MSLEPINYLDLTRQALRGVMAQALSHAAENGLIDGQHFFITYRTGHSGVVMPGWLHDDYPEEMTIVIQHEYWDLAVMADRFSVGLSFNDRSVTLVVPFAAVKSFGDPSVNFRLDIPLGEESEDVSQAEPEPEPETLPAPDDAGEAEGGESTVVSLDAFRKK